jgi:hypothetical protein
MVKDSERAEVARASRRFARNLVILRSRSGLTQLEVAARSGLHRTEVGLLESGRRASIAPKSVTWSGGSGFRASRPFQAGSGSRGLGLRSDRGSALAICLARADRRHLCRRGRREAPAERRRDGMRPKPAKPPAGELRERFGINLRECRKRLGIAIAELASPQPLPIKDADLEAVRTGESVETRGICGGFGHFRR